MGNNLFVGLIVLGRRVRTFLPRKVIHPACFVIYKHGGGNNDIRERIRDGGIMPYMWILCCKLLPVLLSSQGTVNVSRSSNDIIKKNPVTAFNGHNRI